jgi:hypothetical protein
LSSLQPATDITGDATGLYVVGKSGSILPASPLP